TKGKGWMRKNPYYRMLTQMNVVIHEAVAIQERNEVYGPVDSVAHLQTCVELLDLEMNYRKMILGAGNRRVLEFARSFSKFMSNLQGAPLVGDGSDPFVNTIKIEDEDDYEENEGEIMEPLEGISADSDFEQDEIESEVDEVNEEREDIEGEVKMEIKIEDEIPLEEPLEDTVNFGPAIDDCVPTTSTLASVLRSTTREIERRKRKRPTDVDVDHEGANYRLEGEEVDHLSIKREEDE
ncbi:hypothetical protein PFISCL1PPCAC_10860, partial [Pristionchus fissidentatus]